MLKLPNLDIEKELLEYIKDTFNNGDYAKDTFNNFDYTKDTFNNNRGIKIIGIDEVGRGAFAGPIVACSLVANFDSIIPGVRDSKKLTPNNRFILYEKIIQNHEYSFGIASPEEIDAINILNANILSVKRASNMEFDFALVDGIMKFDDKRYISIKGGDALSYTIAAASIVAKVYRDCLMKELSLQYPQYGFEKNKGYGTTEHILAIKKYGFVKGLHRESFIKSIIN
jgi:ribonuclease HII